MAFAQKLQPKSSTGADEKKIVKELTTTATAAPGSQKHDDTEKRMERRRKYLGLDGRNDSWMTGI